MPDPIPDRTEELGELHQSIFGPAPSPSVNGQHPAPPAMDVDEIIQRASSAQNGGKFRRLMAGDITGYNSHSEADAALCSLLAFWTRDPAIIDAVMRQSGLYGEKWDRDDYRELTIAGALAIVQETYSPRGKVRRRRPSLSQASAGVSPAAASSQHPTSATQLVKVAAVTELFHTPAGDAFATVPVVAHRETWPVRSGGFRDWLRRAFYEAEGRVPGGQSVQDALGVIEGKARWDGPERPVFTRLAEHGGAIYLDLCNTTWEVVEVNVTGWRVLPAANTPVRFRRAKGMLPLPCPVSGGTLDELRPFVNAGSEGDFRLMVAWLLAALRPTGPYPVLPLAGEQGSAKSSTARVLRSLVDPNTAPLRKPPRNEHDLAIAAGNSWVIALDNLSHITEWLSDDLARLATGGGFATRALYSDSEEVIFDAKRPVLLTGIEDLATRPDLLDRAIPLDLPVIPKDQRRPEDAFWSEFEPARPRLLGALLDAVAGALRELPHTQLQELPRMADFALWATAAEGAMGWPAGAFMAAYEGNRADANAVALEASPIGAALLKHLSTCGGAGWSGTATDLLTALNEPRGHDKNRGDDKAPRGWPGDARALSGAVKRLAPNLRAAGWNVIFARDGTRANRRMIRLEKVCDFASDASAASEQEQNLGRNDEASDANSLPSDANSVLSDANSDGLEPDYEQSDAADAADAE